MSWSARTRCSSRIHRAATSTSTGATASTSRATFVEVTGGGTATVAAELSSLTKGSVAGTVAGVGGGSGEGFNVSLYDASNNYRGVTTAGAGGAFVSD